MRRLALLTFGVLLLAAPAHADRATWTHGADRPKAERLRQLEPVPLPSPMPAVVASMCPTAPEKHACTGPSQPIYIHPDTWDWRETYWHELGHHTDYTLMNDWLRDRFRGLIGDPNPWRSLGNSPHEKFAEAYASCALGLGRWRGAGYEPSERLHRRVCLFMSRL